MQEQLLRYECVLEPNGRWMVWDIVHDLPAQFSQIALIGLSHREAVSLCRLLNETSRSETRQSRAS
ncbi:hypothetical protein NKG95_04805 [Mesorhizobium sp. M1423]|uniref:hypothetical protein n=1 Tax=Mesorhizobium sp. M1423 TaxID=2957101 RepID=UPI00333967F6